MSYYNKSPFKSSRLHNAFISNTTYKFTISIITFFPNNQILIFQKFPNTTHIKTIKHFVYVNITYSKHETCNSNTFLNPQETSCITLFMQANFHSFNCTFRNCLETLQLYIMKINIDICILLIQPLRN